VGSYDFEWLSSNLFISYPFVTPAPQAELVAPESPSSSSSPSAAPPELTNLGTVFADAVLYTSDMLAEQVKLTAMSMLFHWPTLPSHGRCKIEFESGFELDFDYSNPEVEFRAEIYGRWLVVEWKLIDAAPMSLPNLGAQSVRDAVCRFLISLEAVEELDSLNLDLSGVDAWLESGVIHTGPKRVRRAFLKIGNYLFELNDTILLEPGFNINLTHRQFGDPGYVPPDADAVRQLKTVLIDAIPGVGKGRYLRCLPDPAIRTVSGVGADARGNLELDTRDCYWLEKPVASGPSPAPPESQVQEVATVEPHKLRMRNACEECCACEEYVSTYRSLQAIWQAAQTLSARYQQILTDYLALRQTLIDLGAGDDPSIKVVTRSRAGFIVDVSFIFINGNTALEGNTQIVFDILLSLTPFDFDITYVNGSGIFSAAGGYSNQALDPDEVSSGDGSKWELEFTNMTMPSSGAINWTGSFRIRAGDQDRSGAKFTAEVTLNVDGVEVGKSAAASLLKKPEKLD